MIPPSLHKPKGSVIVIILDLIEKDQLLFVISAGEKHHHRGAQIRLVEIVEYIVGTKERIALADAGQKDDGILWSVFLDVPDDKAVILA